MLKSLKIYRINYRLQSATAVFTTLTCEICALLSKREEAVKKEVKGLGWTERKGGEEQPPNLSHHASLSTWSLIPLLNNSETRLECPSNIDQSNLKIKDFNEGCLQW